MEGIKKIIKDENGVEFEITEYPDVPVVVVKGGEEDGL